MNRSSRKEIEEISLSENETTNYLYDYLRVLLVVHCTLQGRISTCTSTFKGRKKIIGEDSTSTVLESHSCFTLEWMTFVQNTWKYNSIITSRQKMQIMLLRPAGSPGTCDVCVVRWSIDPHADAEHKMSILDKHRT
jgi:hypothetical protein